MSPNRKLRGVGLVLALSLALSACARSESTQDASVSVAEGIDQQSREWDAAEQKAGRPAARERGPEAQPAEEVPAR
jgi:ABC-type oligopeptide transport system substrate-binding subunit